MHRHKHSSNQATIRSSKCSYIISNWRYRLIISGIIMRER